MGLLSEVLPLPFAPVRGGAWAIGLAVGAYEAEDAHEDENEEEDEEHDSEAEDAHAGIGGRR
ncbi:hypothetical protein AB0I00_02305 [Streptomyces sp. NPDC050803]|uniref:hypothetical protein n=1 Tax=unclassified Streptomyces TaxID=2593676 RepID=UPI00342A28DE